MVLAVGIVGLAGMDFLTYLVLDENGISFFVHSKPDVNQATAEKIVNLTHFKGLHIEQVLGYLLCMCGQTKW